MKPLHVLAADMSDIAALLNDLSEQLTAVSAFFGMPVGKPGAPSEPKPATIQLSPPVTRPLPQPVLPTLMAPPVPRPAAAAPPAPEQIPAPNGSADPHSTQYVNFKGTVITRRLPVTHSRKLSKAEKDAVRADWNALPANLRNATNRAALAAKHNCSTGQVFAINRTDLMKNLASAHAARGRKALERAQQAGE